MPIKKSELYSSIWKSCDELRGGMDASQYKDYVLVLLFVKYVSDKYAGQKDALLEVPKGGRFADMVALKGNKEIGEKMNKIISKLVEANDLKGVIDVADFNDADKLGKGKEMVDRLSKVILSEQEAADLVAGKLYIAVTSRASVRLSARAELRLPYRTGVAHVNRFRWIAKGGRVIEVETRSTIIKDEAGASIGMRGVTVAIAS